MLALLFYQLLKERRSGKKRERHEKISERGLASLDKFKAEVLD